MNEQIKITGFDKFGRVYSIIPLIETDIVKLKDCPADCVSGEIKVAFLKLRDKIKEEEDLLIKQILEENKK